MIATDESEAAIMSSIEGTPDQIWPTSAPLQDISRHSLQHGDAILCVGMAGKSHWSASFSVESNQQSSTVKADLACLQKVLSPGAKLGSTYALGEHCQVQSFTDHRVEIRMDENVFQVDALSGGDFSTVFELNERTLTIRPGEISTSPVIATRWGFLATTSANAKYTTMRIQR
jgi:hypothetical protein